MAHPQFPNPVPNSSSSVVIKKEAAYTSADGLFIHQAKMGKSTVPITSIRSIKKGPTVNPPRAHIVAQASAKRLTIPP